MSDIHPHWQTNEPDDGREVSVDSMGPNIGPQRIAIGGKEVSRRPAAIAGMLLVVGAAFIFYRGVDGLAGSLGSSSALLVHITESGLDPEEILVRPGDTITWINDQSIPHILESDTLCDSVGSCLHTATLFTGESDSFTVSEDIPLGTYEYFSTTAESIVGTIVISGAGASESSSSETVPPLKESATTDTVSNSMPIVAKQTSGTDTHTQTQQVVTARTGNAARPQGKTSVVRAETTEENQAMIPRNPYTVDSSREHPFDESGTPVASLFDEGGDTGGSDSQAFQDGRGPLRNTESGMGTWIIVGASIVGLWLVTRRALRKTPLA